MALKKPSDFFVRESGEDNIFEETENAFSLTVSDDEGLQTEINRVHNLSEQVAQLQQELSQKVVQTDLEKIVLSQIKAMQENFNNLQSNLREANEEDIFDIRTVVSELSEIVTNLLEQEIPKYKKQVTKNKVRIIEEFNQFKEEVNQNNDKVKEELETFVQEIDGTLQSFSENIEGTAEEVKKTSKTYNRLSKILEKKLNDENEKLESYSQNINKLYEKFVEFRELFEERNIKQQKTIEETFESINLQVENKFESIDEQIDGFKSEVSLELSNIKADVVVNEQHLKNFSESIEDYNHLIENVNDFKTEISSNITSIKNDIEDKGEKIESYGKRFKAYEINLEKLNNNINEVESSINDVNNDLQEKNEILKEEINSIKVDVAVNEQHLKSFKNTIKEYDEKLENVDEVFLEYDNRLENVDRYLKDNYKDLVLLKEEVLSEIKNLSNEDLLEDIERLERKIDFIKDTYSKIKPEVIVKEVISEGLLNEPSETKNSDPLTPLDKKFVTLEQLQQHYRIFINRIQQQLSTIGGGGETRLEFLDDIDRTSAKVDGKVLKYDGTLKKWVGADGGGGAGSQTLNQTLGFGNTSSIGMSVGVVTTPSINFTSGAVLDDIYNDGGFGLKSAVNQYATIASNNLQQFVAVDDLRILIGAAYTGDTNNYKYWNFDKNGNITFPNNTIQSTAFTGYANTAGISTYAATSGVSTALQNSRNFSIGGNFVTAPAISFNGTGNVAFAATLTPKSVGLGTYTSGDYVKSVVGTSNQITVTGGTGEGSNPVLSFAPNPTIPGNVTIANDLQVNRNLNVTGNITIGGTSAYIISNDFRVKDADIVLGFTTDSFGNDASNDTTANHGGIAIASTEGTPLVQIFNPAIGETNPATYKKIMWFKSGSFAGLNTDAWLINYGVGIGSTQFPAGTRLAAGAVQITERDLAVVRNINASGVVTATTFSGNATSATTSGYAATAGISTVAQGLTGTPNLNVGIVTASSFIGNLTGTATTATNLSDATNITTGTINSARLSGNYNISVTSATTSGYAATAGIATVAQGLTGTPNLNVGVVTATSYSGSGINLTGIVTSIVAGTNITISGSTGQVTINSTDSLNVFLLMGA